jgi:hypothetical protein
LFNNLDYSFVAGREDGTFVYPKSQPGGGSPTLRRQYGFLRKVMTRFDFVRMRPDSEVIKADFPSGVTARTLANPGKEYLIYFRSGLGDKKTERKTRFADGELKVRVNVPLGLYAGEWLDPKTGASIAKIRIGPADLGVPAFSDDIVLTLRKD